MSDQCKNCTVRGDLKACKSTPCFHHENWYAIQLESKIEELTKENERLKAEIEDPWKRLD